MKSQRTSNGLLPARKQVLSINEILRMIFEFSSKADNAINARVCKAWSNEALNVLWESVVVLDALSVLAPIDRRYDEDCLPIFERRITRDDWMRFDLYSWRVRTLDLFDLYLSDKALEEIASTRPREAIFPNLAEITARELELDYGLFFCHPSVLRLSMGFIESDSDIDKVFSDLHIKTPRLTSLEFDCIGIINSLEPTLRRFCSLTTLKVCGSTITPKTMNALSSLPIKELTITSFHEVFPSLDEAWTIHNCEKAIDAIALSCPQLERLQLETFPEVLHVSFSSILPIFKLSNLRHLAFIHMHPSDHNTVDLTSIFQALPLLTGFSMYTDLFSHPPYRSLPLSVLCDIIPFCGHLEVLRLQLDASLTQLPNISSSLAFPKLQELHFKDCAIDDPIPVAALLSTILPLDCLFYYSIRSDQDAQKWKMVQELFPAFRFVKRLASSSREQNN